MGKDTSQSQDSSQKNVEMQMDFRIVEDIPEELEDFIFLSRLGLFEEAEELYLRNLKPYLTSFPVFVEYADMLLEKLSFSALSRTLATLPTGTEFSTDQNELLMLMKALSDVPVRWEPNNAWKQRDDTMSKLEAALELAQNWHDKVQNDPQHFTELEIHTLEIYLSIIVLAETTSYALEERYYQPPKLIETCENRWDGFQKWCIILNKQSRFWEAHKIFVNLIAVLDPNNVDRLFKSYLDSLKDTLFTDATAIAELAATNAYISWNLREMKREERYRISSEMFDKVTRAKSLLLYLFGGKADVRRGRFKDWLQNLLSLQNLSKLEFNNIPIPGWRDMRTPFSWAAEKGHEDIVELLLENNIDPDTADIVSNTYEGIRRLGSGVDGTAARTPLSYAAEYGHEDIVKRLLDKLVDPDLKDNNGRTPLSYAAACGHEEVVKQLLDKHVDPDSRDKLGQSPLLWAAANRRKEVLKLLLDKHVDPDLKDSNGRTPLSYAAAYGLEEVVKLLLDKHVDPNSRDNIGRSPLSWAAANGREGVLKLLLDKHVDPDLKDNNGRTPLSWAAEKGYSGVMKLLLDTDVHPNPADENSWTPLLYAAAGGYRGAVSLLLTTKRVNPYIGDRKYNRTPLLWAARFGHSAVVELFLNAGFDPDPKDYFGQTPLSLAAEYGHESVVTLLLQSKADLESRDKWGRTPVSWAAEKGHEHIRELLLKTNIREEET